MRFTVTILFLVLVLVMFDFQKVSCQTRFATNSAISQSDSVSVDFADQADTTHPIPAYFFGAGFATFGQYSDYAWTMLKQAGFVNVRFDASFGIVWQSATSTPDFSAIDPTVSLVQSEGLHPIMIMDYCPTWLQTSSTNSVPSSLSEWADLAAQYVHHEDVTFPGVIENYEIWNEPNLSTGNFGVSDSAGNVEYDSLFAEAAFKMYAQALADGATIRVGGPAMAKPLADTAWVTRLLSNPDSAPYVKFISLHYYPGCSSYGDSSAILSYLFRESAGIEQWFNTFATVARSANGPNAATVPIYIDEYNSSSCPQSSDPVRNSPKWAPLWNSLFVIGVLHSAYDSSRTMPSKLLYFTSSYASAGYNLLTNNFLAPTPYPQFYVYDLMSSAKYLDITNHGYLAHSVSTSTDTLSAAAFFTPNSESVLIVNPTWGDFSNVTVNIKNPGFNPTADTLFLLNQSNPSIKGSVLTATATAAGYQSVIDVPPLSIVALKYSTTITGVEGGPTGLPKGFELEQNYPNPFNPATTIGYSVPARSLVNISVYDVLGRKVRTLVDGVERSGSYSVTFNASSLPSGVYLCRMSAGTFAQTIKVMLVK